MPFDPSGLALLTPASISVKQVACPSCSKLMIYILLDDGTPVPLFRSLSPYTANIEDTDSIEKQEAGVLICTCGELLRVISV